MRSKLPAKSEVHFSSLYALNGKSHMSNFKSLFYNGIFSQVATAYLETSMTCLMFTEMYLSPLRLLKKAAVKRPEEGM